jgi:hypothetical protein
MGRPRKHTSDQVVEVRMEKEVLEKVDEMKQGSICWRGKARATFLGHIVGIGVAVYEKHQLPAEMGDVEFPSTSRASPRAAKTGTDQR